MWGAPAACSRQVKPRLGLADVKLPVLVENRGVERMVEVGMHGCDSGISLGDESHYLLVTVFFLAAAARSSERSGSTWCQREKRKLTGGGFSVNCTLLIATSDVCVDSGWEGVICLL